MTKKEIIKATSKETGVTIKDITEILSAAEKVLVDNLTKGEIIRLAGLGAFSVIRVKARESVDPRDQSPIVIPAHNKVKFKCSQTLTRAVNE